MEFTEPMPFAAAVARLESKTPVAAALSSEQWAQLQLGLRDRAFFSAQVDSLRTVATMQQKIDEALSVPNDPERAFMDRSKFIADMRAHLGAAAGDSGQLTDLTSTTRLGLIYDFQVEDAQEFGRWQAAQDPALLDEFPAQELVRIESRENERDWAQRWSEAGGQFYGNRMIARKDDPIWTKISRFGRPWPPFDFNSGMGVEDIDRDQAIEWGVIQPGDTVESTEADFNQRLEASVPKASPELLEGFKDVFGDQVDVGRDGKITWQGQRVQKLFESLDNPAAKNWSLDLGTASDAAVSSARSAGVDLSDARLVLQRDQLAHADKVHGVGRETRADQRPLTALDYQLIPHVWRTPDSIRPGTQPGTLEFSANIAGRRALVVFDRGVAAGAGPANRWGVRTLYVKKEGGMP